MDKRYLEDNTIVTRLSKVKDFARANCVPVILDDSANILANIVKYNKPNRIFEIGTAIGYSGTIMLLNNAVSTLDTVEINKMSYDRATTNFEAFGVLNRANQHLSDAYDYILSHKDEKFDLIFLDGPKGQYIKYLPFLINMLDDRGMLVADNVLFKGLVKSQEKIAHKHRTIVMNLRKFISEVENDNALQSELVDIGDGIMIITKQ